MNDGPILFQIDKEELLLSRGELCQRLMVSRDFDLSVFYDVQEEVFNAIDCKMAAVRIPVEKHGVEISFGGICVKSNDLYTAVGSSCEIFVFCVTLGIAVDRLLISLSKLKSSSLFIADAIASAYAEAAADKAQSLLDTICKTQKRFSPGYGDLPLELQPKILELLSAEKALGITLTQGLLMKPLKSITAIVGIENET